jgi:hypothetical protein
MNTPPAPPAAATFANALPKLAALALLVVWGHGGGELPLPRLCAVLGAFALFEAVTAAAMTKAKGVLEWGDLPALLKALIAPAGLPLYVILGAILFAVGEDPNHGRPLTTSPLTGRNLPITRPTSSNPPMGFPRPTSSGSSGTNLGAPLPVRPSFANPPPRPGAPSSTSVPGRPVGGMPATAVRTAPPTPAAPAGPSSSTPAAAAGSPTNSAKK